MDGRVRRALSNNALMASLAGLVLVSSFIASDIINNYGWFGRFGCIVVIVGVLVLARTFVSGHGWKDPVIMAETGISDLSRKHYEKLGEPVPMWVVQQERNAFAIGTLGPTLTLLGTVVWGFGDLLPDKFM